MFKRKQDLDKHVQSVLRRKKDEKDRFSYGFQIARLYKEINEYETARRYLAGFLQVRENSCQGHQLMGEINEGLGKIDAAIESYKRSLDLGGFTTANRHLVLKICELFCEQGTDTARMKYWLEKCEALYPRSDVIYRLKAQIASSSANGNADKSEMEKILVDELLVRPRDVDLRIKLLNLYVDTGRIDFAYDTAVSTDLTTAFTSSLPWYQCLQNVFKLQRERNEPDPAFLQLHLHVLRSVIYLSLSSKSVITCVEALISFDQELKIADSLRHQDEAWTAILGEMKGQFFFLAALLILKRAMAGSLPWPEANQLSGACFLASQKISPLDAQAPWFVRPPDGYLKLYQWWHTQSYDRFSQVGHMIQQLAGNDVTDWSKLVCGQTMTAMGHKRVFETLYGNFVTQSLADSSFLYGSSLMVGEMQEPFSWRQLLDIDRVASQVHLGNLSHLVWLCLQRYVLPMKSQPNYHFALMENIRFSVKNIEAGSCESLCQLDILTFLLATVRCAAISVSESSFLQQDNAGRPSLLPACLSSPLCTAEQDEWWNVMHRFCTDSVRDDFSRLRRVLIRGIEAVRLIGSHGVSLSLQCHLARSLDAKVESLRKSELGSRCSAAELTALEDRAVFYWGKARVSLEKMLKNQQLPVVKNCLFKESVDTDLTPALVEELLSEASFAIAKSAYMRGRNEEALEGFIDHKSPWASFYCGQIYKNQGEISQDEVYKALMRKARECFYQTLDRLNGDKSHELNLLVAKGIDDLEVEIQAFDLGDTVDGPRTPLQNVSRNLAAEMSAISHNGTHDGAATTVSHNGTSIDAISSTPRPGLPHLSPAVNGNSPPELQLKSSPQGHANADIGTPLRSVSATSNLRPSPERLESQIRSLNYSQTTLFKTVLDRNEELVLMHSRMMEEHRNNNNELKTVLTENKVMMEELKTVLADNKTMMDKQKAENKDVMDGLKKENKERMEELKILMTEASDMLKLMKTDLATLKPGVIPPQALPPGPPLILPPHLSSAPPGFHPPQPAVVPAYPGYLLNSSMPPPPGPPQVGATGAYRNSGLQGSRLSTVGLGKYKTSGDEEEDEEEADNGEDLSAVYSEYYDPDQSFNQYYTPDSHVQDWSLRAQLDNTMSLSPVMQPPRMTMPQPGFFASALRGPSLQYAQTGQVSPSAAPGLIRPGFFSTPSASTVSFPAPGTITQAVNTSGTSSGANIFTGLSSSANPSVSSSQMVSSTATVAAGIEILMVIRGHFPAKNAAGAITILSTPINKASVVMMSDAKEMLFHHDISGLQLGEFSHPNMITWTAMKSGSAEKDTVVIKVDSDSEAEMLRKTLLKYSSCSGKISESSQVSATLKEDTSKPFAGFTFKLPSNLSSTQQQQQQPSPFSPLANSEGSKTDISVTQTPPKTSQPSLVSTNKSGGKGEDERLDEYEPNVDFKPVISLPALVEKKTGEEDETVMFVERCRMFRYDQSTSQWKERGVGEIKILSNNSDVSFRVVMRRDQIFKLCANHIISEEMKLTPLASSDRSWCYNAMDFSDEEMKMENLAVKFKNADKAKKFQEVFTKCQELLIVKGNDKSNTSAISPGAKSLEKSGLTAAATSPSSTQVSATAAAVSAPTSSWDDRFKPKIGSWECSGCLIRNDAEVLKCPACETLKPGVTKEDLPKSDNSGFGASTIKFGSGGGFTFGNMNPATSSVPAFGSPEKSESTAAATAASSAPSVSTTAAVDGAPTSSWGDKFKPKIGSWECSGCLIRNDAEVLKCPACETLKPGVTKEDLPKSDNSGFGASTIKFGSGGGFTFGNMNSTTSSGPAFGSPSQNATPVFGSSPQTSQASAQSGFTFNKEGGFSFGTIHPATTSSTSTTTTSGSTSTTTTSSGFSFTPSSGFSFGPSVTPKTTSTTAFVPASALSNGTYAAVTSSKGTDATASSTPANDKAGDSILASLLTSDDSEETQKKDNVFKFSMTPSKPASSQLFGQPVTTMTSTPSTGFNFSFNKTPSSTSVKSPPASAESSKFVPGSPEVDEHGNYVTREGDDTHIHFEPVVRLPQNIEIKTGEEEEDVLFESRGKMYRFANGEWKERGLGVVKILEHRGNKTTRILMRRDRILKLCCNHRIDPSLTLQPMINMEGKAWIWYALDFSEDEPKMEQLALRFRNSEIATEFKDIFNRCKGSAPAVSASKPESGKTLASGENNLQNIKSEVIEEEPGEDDDDVIFVKEEIPDWVSQAKGMESPLMKKTDDDEDVVFIREEVASQEQIMKARKFLLPDHFYLYENKSRCPGCLGCTDGEGLPPWATSAKPVNEKTTAPMTTTANVFGEASSSNLPDFAKLSQGGSESSQLSASVFGSGTGMDFSNLVGKSSSNGFAFAKKGETSSPFKFQGAGQKLFGTGSPGGGDGEGDDEIVAPSSEIHFEPVIPLPDLVEIKTGEEDWVDIFVHRAKVYKFFKDVGQWKECGVGEMKIMKHNERAQFRILMRRDQVLKLACNHLITVDMNLKSMASSETSWCWVALDHSDIDTEPSVDQFAVRFKKKDTATNFKTIFEDCQTKLKEASEACVTSTTSEENPPAHATEEGNEGEEEDQSYDDEEEEEERIIFEKRATLSCYIENEWEKLGMGNLIVKYNEDVNGNSVEFIADDERKLCSHIICREHHISQKTRSCEWQPIDYSMDEPIRRHFCCTFSSVPAAEEYAKVFTEGQQLAIDSELSEKLSTEIDIPEVFSGGAPRH